MRTDYYVGSLTWIDRPLNTTMMHLKRSMKGRAFLKWMGVTRTATHATLFEGQMIFSGLDIRAFVTNYCIKSTSMTYTFLPPHEYLRKRNEKTTLGPPSKVVR